MPIPERKGKPPLGVEPYKSWRSGHEKPSIEDLVTRYGMVLSAVRRYREAGYEPMAEWLCELGVHQSINPSFLDPEPGVV